MTVDQLGSMGPPTGRINFVDPTREVRIGGALLQPQPNGNAVATLDYRFPAAGPWTVLATYDGDANYFGNRATLTETVVKAKAKAQLTPDANPVAVGAPANFTVAASDVDPTDPILPTGQVDLFDGTIPLGSATLDATGHATFTTYSLSPGIHTINAVVDGDQNFTASDPASAMEMVGTRTTTTLTSDGSPSRPSHAVTFAVTVTAATGTPTGTVTLLDGALTLGTATLTQGMYGATATFLASGLPLGGDAITADYNGDVLDAFSSATMTQLVQQLGTTTSLWSSASPSLPGQPVTLTAAVSVQGMATPTGRVAFYSDGALLDSAPVTWGMYGPTATLTTSSLPEGDHTITAVYLGDEDTSSSKATMPQSVRQLGTTTSLSDSTSSSAPGQPVTFTAAVSRGMMMGMAGALTGTVAFETVDGTVLDTEPVAAGIWGGYQATWTTSTLPLGVDTVLAVYGGDSADAGSTSSPLTETVAKVSTSTSLSSNLNPATPGQAVTFTATVASSGMTGMMMAGTPTGNVTFRFTDADGNVLMLGTGTLTPGMYGAPQATFTTSSLPQGAIAVTATFGDDTTFTGSNAGLTETVRQLTPSVSLYANNTSTYLGTSVTFTASVWGAWGAASPTGTVTFRDGATDLATVGLTPGMGGLQAVYTTSSLGVGSHPISAIYNGDVTYVSATSSPLNETVTRPTAAVNLWAYNTSTVVGGQVTLRATVFGASGSTTPTGTVTFFNGTTALGTAGLDATMMEAGAFLLTTALPAGNDVITAVYNGDLVYLSARSYPLNVSVNQPTASVGLGVSSQYVTVGQAVTLTASVWGTYGAANPTGSVTFRDGTTALATAGLSQGMGSPQASFTTSWSGASSRALAAASREGAATEGSQYALAV